MNQFKVHTTKFNIGLPTEYAIEIYQRKSFKQTYQAVDAANGEPVNLSPYTIAMQIRRDVTSNVPLVELSPGNGIENEGDKLTVKLTSEQTEKMVGSAVGDVMFVNDGIVQYPLRFLFTVPASVTR